MSSSLQEIADKLKSYKRIMLTGHEQPDGDSIGSTLALSLALQQLGKEVFPIDWDNPQKFNFLPSFNLFQSFRKDWSPEIIVYVDCSDEYRIPENFHGYLDQGLPVINIDHHVSNQYFGDLNYVDANAAATGEIIYELIKLLNVEIGKDIALCLYIAISTDTGSFRYSSTTSYTHRLAAELISKNLDVGYINTLLFDEMPIEAFTILQHALASFEISADGRVAWITLRNEELQKLGGKAEHTESLINYTRMVKGVEVGLLFKEIEGNLVKVGLRSKGNVDVNKLAQKFGGGGHAKASGCKVKGTIEEVKAKVLQEVTAIFE